MPKYSTGVFSNSISTIADQMMLICCKSQFVIFGLTHMFQIYLYVCMYVLFW